MNQQHKPIYVICGTDQEFFDYQRTADSECYRVIDGNTLRERTPGAIIYIGSYDDLWNLQEIHESAQIHEDLWKDELTKQTVEDHSSPDNQTDLFGYGV